jgi:hypothetical protein
MPTLRERVREALSASEPGEREAARELETILERAKSGKRRPGLSWPLLLAPVLVAAALFFFLLFPRHAPVAPVAPVAAKSGVHLYLGVTGEPADRAITLDLDSKGEL